MRNRASTAVPHRTAAAEGGSLRRSLNNFRYTGAGRPSVGGRRTVVSSAPSSFPASVRAVCRAPVSELLVLHGRMRCACASSNTVSLPRQSASTENTQPGFRSVMSRSCTSLALRGTAAPHRCVGAGTGFARAAGVGASCHAAKPMLVAVGRGAPSVARPNPSVEGTHNGGARWCASSRPAAPLCAPHLKR